MNDHNEKPIILVVVTFFLALTLVYIAFFRTQPVSDSWNDVNVDTAALMSWLLNSTSTTWTMNLSWTLDEWIELSSSASNSWNSSTWLIISSWNNIWNWSDKSWKEKANWIQWIKPWFGSIAIAELLWLSVKDAFIDTWSIQYWYLWTGGLDDLAATVRRLWWNVLAIETENDINKNLLRWDRILFINIPQVTFVRQPTEQKLLVAMIVIIGDDKWIIEAKIDRYYSSKKFMKTFFEQLYWKTL